MSDEEVNIPNVYAMVEGGRELAEKHHAELVKMGWAAPEGTVTITKAELWTIFAALRWYQQCRMGEAENRPPMIHEVASDGGDVTPLNDERINLLTERLNGADVIRVDYA